METRRVNIARTGTTATASLAAIMLFSPALAFRQDEAPRQDHSPSFEVWTDAFGSHLASSLLGDYQSVEAKEVSEAAARALGNNGMQRLADFLTLESNWDSNRAEPLKLQSLNALSRFFADTQIAPEGLSVFLTPLGHLSVNWLNSDGHLAEIEFGSDEATVFLESPEVEQRYPRGDVGTSGLLRLLQAHSFA